MTAIYEDVSITPNKTDVTLTTPVRIKLSVRIEGQRYPDPVINAEKLDLDLLQIKLERALAQYGDESISLDHLLVGEFECRSSYFIRTLSELKTFLDNLVAYATQDANKATEQAIAEYVACYDENYHQISPIEVLAEIPKRIISAKKRNEINRDDRKNKILGYGKDYMVIFNEPSDRH